MDFKILMKTCNLRLWTLFLLLVVLFSQDVLGTPSVDCELPFEEGPCKAYIPAWWYNSDRGECERRVYGGCGGNANNFVTKSRCLKYCKGNWLQVCELPFEKGPCMALLPVWYFSSATGRCESTYYGGCGGNQNNFFRKQDCLDLCGQH
ncbi:hypothetical protein ILUMI_05151 [Ignelater luminosus]|uniref:BPTI/Kunitz inhibitor domain-containing protein n=1 Tax=Ignelater luminosus TaxID=2038154 RepID=A0A8K0GID6_IGNLU|nr:hypothetical protein ILUMI_05151 [Ignelater luminosus]